jgi:peroxin-10
MVWQVHCILMRVEERLTGTVGTRWLTRWNKEVDLLVKLVYYGFTTGRGVFFSVLCRTFL